MGKSQHALPVATTKIRLNIEMETQTSNWDICPTFVPTLMPCSDKTRLQQRPIIGSPPPKGFINPQWKDDQDIQMNLRLEVPQTDRDNQNNYEMLSSEEVTKTNESHVHKDITKLSNYLEDMRLQPIIVCENVDDSDNDSASDLTKHEAGILNLSVPTVDVSEEKKRPPITDVVSR